MTPLYEEWPRLLRGARGPGPWEARGEDLDGARDERRAANRTGRSVTGEDRERDRAGEGAAVRSPAGEGERDAGCGRPPGEDRAWDHSRGAGGQWCGTCLKPRSWESHAPSVLSPGLPRHLE